MADVTPADLAGFLGTTADALGADAAQVCSAAAELVAATLAGATPPDVVVAQAQVMVAAEMWRRRDAPGGVVNAWGDAQVPVRLALDPLKPARPLLAPWITPGVA